MVVGVALATLGAAVGGVAPRGTIGGAAGVAGVAIDARAMVAGVAKSARASCDGAIRMIPPHTEQRARTLAPGIRAGSTRNTE